MKLSTLLRHAMCSLTIASSAAMAGTTTVDSYPDRAVRLVVPFAPGGSTDLLGRLLSKDMFPASGQTAIVENISGAGGNIGSAAVAKAAPDGYTLSVGAMSTHAMNGSLYKSLSFDPMGDFAPAAILAYVVNVIAVSPKVPVDTFPELIDYIRKNPGKLSYASGGIGTHNHLTLALLAKTAGLDILHVPYRGGGPAVLALLQGEVDMFAGGASLLLPHAREGKIKLIAVTEAQRSALLPGVPSASETIPEFVVTNWYGLFAPKAVDVRILDKLNAEVRRITALPEVVERFNTLGMVRSNADAASVASILAADHKQWSETIRALNIDAQ